MAKKIDNYWRYDGKQIESFLEQNLSKQLHFLEQKYYLIASILADATV